MINRDYLYTTTFEKIDDFVPESNSTYLYGYSPEERSHSVESLIKNYSDSVQFVKLEEREKDIIFDGKSNEEFHLRSSESILKFLKLYDTSTLYIDVTGLSNRICASLINNSIKAICSSNIKNVKIIYAEPAFYDIKQFKSEGVFNDLSEKIEGIEPLPGFATIIPENIDEIQFIALLGFEGGRFTHLIENIQPPRDNIIPIIGVPGFRIEYPFVAYSGNKRPLKETNSWRNIKYACANSLVDIYLLLTKIINEDPNIKIKLAPIGTKPHAIGAVLFAIKHPKNVELVYDNPKRKKQRTEGVGRIVESFISKLLEEN